MSTTPPFETTHIIEWRYKNLKPLVKALKDFKFDKKSVKIRKSKQGTSVEIQLPKGHRLTDEQREQLLRKAHEIKEAPSTELDSSDDDGDR